VDVLSLHEKHTHETHDTTGVDVFRFTIFNTCLADSNDFRAAKIYSLFGGSGRSVFFLDGMQRSRYQSLPWKMKFYFLFIALASIAVSA
jgi:hypothetical protein